MADTIKIKVGDVWFERGTDVWNRRERIRRLTVERVATLKVTLVSRNGTKVDVSRKSMRPVGATGFFIPDYCAADSEDGKALVPKYRAQLAFDRCQSRLERALTLCKERRLSTYACDQIVERLSALIVESEQPDGGDQC